MQSTKAPAQMSESLIFVMAPLQGSCHEVTEGFINLEAVVNVNVPFLAFGMVAFLVAVRYAIAPLTFVSFNAYQAKEAAIVHNVITNLGYARERRFNFHIAVGVAKCPDVGQVYSRTYSPAIVINDFLLNAYAQG